MEVTDEQEQGVVNEGRSIDDSMSRPSTSDTAQLLVESSVQHSSTREDATSGSKIVSARDDCTLTEISENDNSSGHESTTNSEQQLHFCLQLMSGTSLFATEMIVTYELIYMVTFEKLMGMPTRYVSLPGLLSASMSIFCVPIMGRIGDRGSNKMVRKMLMVIISGLFQIGGAMLLLGACIIKLDAPSNSTGTFINEERDGGFSEDSKDSTYVPIEAIMALLAFGLMDLGFDTCSSNTRTFQLESVPSAFHEKVLSLGVFLSGLGGCALGLLGMIDYDTVFDISGNSQAVKGIFLSSFVSLAVFITLPVTFVIGWYIKRREGPESDQEALKESSNQNEASNLNVNSNDTNLSPVDKTSLNLSQRIKITFKKMKEVFIKQKPLVALCVMNFFLSCTVICFEVYFTDFLAEGVYGGDPDAPAGSEERKNFDDGMKTASTGTLVFMASFFLYNIAHRWVAEWLGLLMEFLLVTVIMLPLLFAFAYTGSLYVFYPVAVWNGVYRALIFTTPYVLATQLGLEDDTAGENDPEKQPLLNDSKTRLEDRSDSARVQNIDSSNDQTTSNDRNYGSGGTALRRRSSVRNRQNSMSDTSAKVKFQGRRNSYTIEKIPKLVRSSISQTIGDTVEDRFEHQPEASTPELLPGDRVADTGQSNHRSKYQKTVPEENQGTIISIVFAMVPASYLLLSALMGPLLEVTDNLATPMYFGAACDAIAVMCLFGLELNRRRQRQ